MTARQSCEKWFRVEVTDERGQIVAIESEMLGGREIGEQEEATIRKAIAHLTGFVGGSLSSQPAGGAVGEEMDPEEMCDDCPGTHAPSNARCIPCPRRSLSDELARIADDLEISIPKESDYDDIQEMSFNVADWRRVITALRTAAPSPSGGEKKYARFGNHADPFIDYHVEVHLIRGLVSDYVKNGEGNPKQIAERIDKAWLDVIQPEWVTLKNFLREIDAKFKQVQP
jgi:hypothetical protein